MLLLETAAAPTDPLVAIAAAVGSLAASAALVAREWLKGRRPRPEHKAAVLDEETLARIADRVLGGVRAHYGDRATAYMRHFAKVEQLVEDAAHHVEEIKHAVEDVPEIRRGVEILKDRSHRP